MKRRIILVAICFSLILVTVAYGGDKTLWASSDLMMRFTYNDRWEEVTPTQDSTVVAISWLSRKSKGLMATCYLQPKESSFGRLGAEDIHDQIDSVAKGIKKNTLKRSSEYKQILVEKRYVDNHPCIYLVQTAKVKGLERDFSMKIYSLVTAWNKKEIMFSCVSEVPILYPDYKDFIEEELVRVLRTIQFDRK